MWRIVKDTPSISQFDRGSPADDDQTAVVGRTKTPRLYRAGTLIVGSAGLAMFALGSVASNSAIATVAYMGWSVILGGAAFDILATAKRHYRNQECIIASQGCQIKLLKRSVDNFQRSLEQARTSSASLSVETNIWRALAGEADGVEGLTPSADIIPLNGKKPH